MASFDSSRLRVKQDLSTVLSDSMITDAAMAAGHCWRERLLGPVLTVRLMILAVLKGSRANLSVSHKEVTPEWHSVKHLRDVSL